MMCVHRRALAFWGAACASPAWAGDLSNGGAASASPDLVDPVLVLMIFLAIFVAAAWSLSALLGIGHRAGRPQGWLGRRLLR